MTERGDLEPIGKDVEALLERLGMPSAVDLGRLADDWMQVAGEPFARAARPIGFSNGELIVEVDDGTAASLLKYRVGPLLDRLKEVFGDGAIERVQIRVGKGKKTL